MLGPPASGLSCDCPLPVSCFNSPYPHRAVRDSGAPSSQGYDGDQRLLHRLTGIQVSGSRRHRGIPLSDSRFCIHRRDDLHHRFSRPHADAQQQYSTTTLRGQVSRRVPSLFRPLCCNMVCLNDITHVVNLAPARSTPTQTTRYLGPHSSTTST